MSRREEIEQLIADLKPRLEAIKDDAMAEIREAEHEARRKIDRHEQAARELARVEAEIARLSAEREALPDRAYRAGMDGDDALEGELKERFRNLRPAIESLEDRRGSLKEELHRLDPRGQGNPAPGRWAEAALVASGARKELEYLQERIEKLAEAAVEPIQRTHDAAKGTVEMLDGLERWAR
jgi:DNA repair exonuclease SbcCD ATPase subunit